MWNKTKCHHLIYPTNSIFSKRKHCVTFEIWLMLFFVSLVTYIISIRYGLLMFIGKSKLISELSNSQRSCVLTIRTTFLILLLISYVRFFSLRVSKLLNSSFNNHFPKAWGSCVSFMYCFRRAVTSDPSSFSVQL